MKKSVVLLGMMFTSFLSNASTLGDQLLCKDLQFSQNNGQPSALNNPQFGNIFKENSRGWVNKENFKSTYEAQNNRSTLDGLSVIRVAVGKDTRRSEDKQKINRIFTRTVVSGDIDSIKNTLQDPKKFNLNYTFTKHAYPKNKKGKYMYYAAQPSGNGGTIVSMIQTGAGTGQIHITCGIYDKDIGYLINNDPHFLKVPLQ